MKGSRSRTYHAREAVRGGWGRFAMGTSLLVGQPTGRPTAADNCIIAGVLRPQTKRPPFLPPSPGKAMPGMSVVRRRGEALGDGRDSNPRASVHQRAVPGEGLGFGPAARP